MTVTPTLDVPAGAVAVTLVAESAVTVATIAPNFTVAPATKFVPVIVTATPPASGARAGATAVMVGAGVFT